MSDFATNCIADVTAKLKTISGTPFGDKVLGVYSEDDFSDKTGKLMTPFAGVLYAGLREAAGGPVPGASADLVVSILFGFASSRVGDDSKVAAWDVLSKVRHVMRRTRSPTGHFWRFSSEVYAGNTKGVAFFIQTWKTWTPLLGDG